MRSAYLGLARLGTHPAFSRRDGALRCPSASCDATFSRVAEYEAHFVAHLETGMPDAWCRDSAARWLSWRGYARVARRRGWHRFWLWREGRGPGAWRVVWSGDDAEESARRFDVAWMRVRQGRLLLVEVAEGRVVETVRSGAEPSLRCRW